MLRIVANPLDELAWMRYLTLWPKVGDVTANRVMEKFPATVETDAFISALNSEVTLLEECKVAFAGVAALANNPGEAYIAAKQALWPILEHAYAKDWDKRRGDFDLVEKLIKRHTSILAFIEEYLLDPVSTSAVERLENDDVVSIITIHSAKGAEKSVCYVINVSPGSFPSQYSVDNNDEVEEERRVLYVAMTRAQDELILSRRSYALHSSEQNLAFMDNREYVALKNRIRMLEAVRAKATVLHAEEKRLANNPERIKFAESWVMNVGNEILVEEKKLQTVADSLIKTLADDSHEQPSTTYFLNDLPAELITLEVPAGRSSFWTDGSNLATRNRPCAGVDLS